MLRKLRCLTSFPSFLAPGINAQTILKEASTRIRAKYDFYEMTLQVEDFENDMSDCNQCKPPTN